MTHPPRSSRRLTWSACVTLLILTLTAACVPQGAPSPDSRPSEDASATPAEPAGRLTFAFFGAPATLDPYAGGATDLTWFLARPVYRSLFRFTPDGAVVEDLAEDIEVDASRADVTLRDSRWTDGRAITARDVVLSARRAAPPSGFAGLRARALSPRVVRFTGSGGAWRERLATLTFVLPRGRAGGATAGPFRPASYRPGFRLRLQADASSEPRPRLKGLDVVFVQDVPQMIDLLGSGRVDAALVPSSVNLAERLRARSLELNRALGWEAVVVDLSPDATTTDAAVVQRAVDRDLLLEGLIRDDGRSATDLYPGPTGRDESSAGPTGASGSVSLAVPEGDELLVLIHRALQVTGEARDATVELLEIPPEDLYSTWLHTANSDAALVRLAGGPWSGDRRPWLHEPVSALPLFRVATFVAWTPLVDGPVANPTFEGPLWNAHEWSVGEG